MRMLKKSYVCRQRGDSLGYMELLEEKEYQNIGSINQWIRKNCKQENIRLVVIFTFEIKVIKTIGAIIN